MAVKMRLSRKGRKKAPFYHIIIADSRSPRDGKFIEKLGTYNPMTKPATIEIDRNAAYDWLVKGAQPTDTVKAILRFKGVYYKKHLMRGVKKGAMSVEQADTLWQQWIDAKEGKIEARKQLTKAEKDAFRQMVSGSAKPKAVVADEATKEAANAFKVTTDSEVTEQAEEVVDETPEVVAETTASVVEEITESAESVAEVVADAAEKEAENPAEEVVEVAVEEATEKTEPTVEEATEATEDSSEEA